MLLGKWLLEAPVLLVLHEQTQGVDVGAREEILRAVQAAADSAVAVLYASIQPSDLAAACDRVLVIRGERRVVPDLWQKRSLVFHGLIHSV